MTHRAHARRSRIIMRLAQVRIRSQAVHSTIDNPLRFEQSALAQSEAEGGPSRYIPRASRIPTWDKGYASSPSGNADHDDEPPGSIPSLLPVWWLKMKYSPGESAHSF